MIEATMQTAPRPAGSTIIMSGSSVPAKKIAAEHHGGDDGHGVGLEQVGGHAGAVADVVADVVGDHRRVARVVFGDAGLDLADQVSADVGTRKRSREHAKKGWATQPACSASAAACRGRAVRR